MSVALLSAMSFAADPPLPELVRLGPLLAVVDLRVGASPLHRPPLRHDDQASPVPSLNAHAAVSAAIGVGWLAVEGALDAGATRVVLDEPGRSPNGWFRGGWAVRARVGRATGWSLAVGGGDNHGWSQTTATGTAVLTWSARAPAIRPIAGVEVRHAGVDHHRGFCGTACSPYVVDDATTGVVLFVGGRLGTPRRTGPTRP